MTRRLPNAAALLGFAVAALATAAAALVTLGRVKDAAIDASLHAVPFGAGGAVRVLRPLDFGLLVLAFVALAALPWLEWRRRSFTRLMATMTPGEGWVLAVVLVGWLGQSYLGAGLILGGDVSTHVGRFVEVARGLDEGRLADWTNYQYLGAPLIWFTGPLTYVIGGALTWWLRDAVLVAKLILFSMHVAGGLAMYALLRRWAFRPVVALVGMAAFAGSFAHLHMFLYRGVLPQCITIVFMVLLFWGADGLLRRHRPRWPDALVFALSTTGLIVNHQPHALFIALYLGLFTLVAAGLGFWRWRGLPVLVGAGVLGAFASVVAVVPILLEADGTMIEPEGALFALQLPEAHRLLNLVLWRNGGTVWAADYWAYLGMGGMVLAVVGIGALAGGWLAPARRPLAGAALLCLVLEFFLYNPVVRDVMFMLFFMSILAALGLEYLVERGWLVGGSLLLAVAAILLDLASTSIQPVMRNDKGFLLEAGRYIERTAPNQRVIQVGIDGAGAANVDMGPQGTPLAYAATIQRVAGNHNMAATRVHNFLGATAHQAQEQLIATGTLSAQTRALFAMWNVGRVICSSPVANGCPATYHDTEQDPVLGRFIPIQGTPAMFSRHLVEQRLEADTDKPMLWPVFYTWPWEFGRIRRIEAALQRFVATEQPDAATRMAAAIPIQQAVPPGAEVVGPETPWHPAVIGYSVSLDRVSIRIRSDGAGWVQLAHPWFPSTVVTVNGVRVTPLRGTIGLMVLAVEPGTSAIDLREGHTLVRTASEWASLVGLVLIFAGAGLLAWWDRRTVQEGHIPG